MEEDIKALREYLDSGDQHDDYHFSHGYGKHLENVLNRLEQEERVIDKIKEYAHQEIVTYDETIKDYIDDDRVGNADYIGELRERKEHWKDIERIINNDEKLYMDWWRYGLYE